MAITYVGDDGGEAGQYTITNTIPAGAEDGDLLIIFYDWAGGIDDATYVTYPSGWTTIGSYPTGPLSGVRHTAMYAVYDSGSPPGLVTSQSKTDEHFIGCVTAWRGVDTTDPVDTFAQGDNSQTGATVHSWLPGVTTTVDEAMVVIGVATAKVQTFGSWTNASLESVTEGFEVSTTLGYDGSLAMAYGIDATAGAVGTSSVTISTSYPLACHVIALAPSVPTDAGNVTYGRTITIG